MSSTPANPQDRGNLQASLEEISRFTMLLIHGSHSERLLGPSESSLPTLASYESRVSVRAHHATGFRRSSLRRDNPTGYKLLNKLMRLSRSYSKVNYLYAHPHS